jgi:hypothetical protein
MIDNLEQAITNYYNKTDKLEGKKEISDIICSVLIDNGLKIPDIDNVLLHLFKLSHRLKFKYYLLNKLEDPRCAMCEANNELQMHHLKGKKTHPELEWEPDNIALLCDTCHRLIHIDSWGASKIDPLLKKKANYIFKNRLKQQLQ